MSHKSKLRVSYQRKCIHFEPKCHPLDSDNFDIYKKVVIKMADISFWNKTLQKYNCHRSENEKKKKSLHSITKQ